MKQISLPVVEHLLLRLEPELLGPGVGVLKILELRVRVHRAHKEVGAALNLRNKFLSLEVVERAFVSSYIRRENEANV